VDTRLSAQDSAQHLAEIARSFLHAVDPALAVRRNLSLAPGALRVANHRLPLADDAQIYLAAIGKAAPGMAQAAVEVLGARLTQGVVTVPRGVSPSPHRRLTYIPAGHPLPDEGSLAAGLELERVLQHLHPEDLLLALVSGGGSAMLEIPAEGVRLDHLRAVNDLLLRSGATIQEINLVRRSLSSVKGGGLAAMAAPAKTVGLLISDVVGDRPEAIASGLTVRSACRRASARDVVEHYHLEPLFPREVLRVLHTPTPTQHAPPPLNVLVATNRLGLEAAAQAAARLGFAVQQFPEPMQGETHQVARAFALALRRAMPPACLLLGGETTIEVRGPGRGGRNQSFALAAALVLRDAPRTLLAALASDGVDGPTDAAGAVVDGRTVALLQAQGIDAQAHLRQRDAYPALQAAGALVYSGPSGTNVGDWVIGLRYAM
jgi:hydroxypyruvate reductase